MCAHLAKHPVKFKLKLYIYVAAMYHDQGKAYILRRPVLESCTYSGFRYEEVGNLLYMLTKSVRRYSESFIQQEL